MQTTLTHAQVEAHDPEGGKGRRWLCPLPACQGHTDIPRHRSLKVETDGVFFCHRCRAGGQLKEFWKEMRPQTRREREGVRVRLRSQLISKRLEEIGRRFHPVAVSSGAGALAAISAGSPVPSVAAPMPAADTDPTQKGALPWSWRAGGLSSVGNEAAAAFLASRGFSDFSESVTRAGARFAPDFARQRPEDMKPGKPRYRGDGAIVFPIRTLEGKLIAVQGRFLSPSKGFSKCLTFGEKSKGVFWGPTARAAFDEGQALAIAEAPFDALALEVAGVPAVALCGASGAPEFLRRGCFGRRYLIAFDADDAGDKAADVIGAELRSLGALVTRLRPEGAKDWNEILQTGGEVWTRTAQSLRALIAREDEASKATGEPSAEVPPEHNPMSVELPHERSEEIRESSGKAQVELPSCAQWRAWFASDRSSPPPGGWVGITREQAGLPARVSEASVQQVATLSPPQLEQVGTESPQWQGIAASLYSPEVELPLAAAWDALHGHRCAAQASKAQRSQPHHAGYMEAWAYGEIPDVREWLKDKADAVWSVRAGVISPEDPEGYLWTQTYEGEGIARDLIAFARWYAGA